MLGMKNFKTIDYIKMWIFAFLASFFTYMFNDICKRKF